MSPSDKQSTFVTAVAWVFIVIAGFSTFMTLLQNVMIFFFFPKEVIKQQIAQDSSSEQIPEFFQFLFSHFDYFFLLALIISSITLIASIGLLKRKNWARVTFIGLMSLGILWNIFGIIMQFYMFDNMPEFAQQDFEFKMMQNIIIGMSVAMAIAFSGLFLWIILKLKSRIIKAEFV